MDEKDVRDLVLKKLLIIFIALVGFITTIKLAIVYYEANFDLYALPSFCSINEFIDCDGIAQTIHSQFFGIPLAYWGMFLYVFILFLVFVDQLKKIKFLGFLKIFKNPFSYISALGFISFLISITLAWVSIFEIRKLCLLCVFTYFLDLFIAIIATDFKAGISESFRLSFNDFIDALKIKKYLISFLSLSIIASLVLAYTTFSCVFTPQVKRYREFKQYEKMQSDSPFKVNGNVLGDPNGKIIVYIYTDYRCPVCRTYNVITHRAAQELGGFKIVHKNLPLDMACNKNVPTPFHEGSCMMSRYAIAAEDQGRFWDLNSELFEKQPKNENDVLNLAKSMGFNVAKLKKDANSAATKERLSKEIDNATNLKIDGTPAIVINGKVYTGIKPYYELKDILIKVGANERKRQ